MTELILCNGCGHLHPTQSPKCMETDCLPDCPTCRAEKAEAERDAAREALARVETLADRWMDVLAEVKADGPGWLLDKGAMAVDTAQRELRAVLARPATDAPRCWRSECRNGCGYPGACPEKPATDEGAGA